MEDGKYILEFAIGFDPRKEKLPENFKAKRNRYFVEDTWPKYKPVFDFVKKGYMKQYAPNFYEVTKAGVAYLEEKYNIKITNVNYFGSGK